MRRALLMFALLASLACQGSVRLGALRVMGTTGEVWLTAYPVEASLREVQVNPAGATVPSIPGLWVLYGQDETGAVFASLMVPADGASGSVQFVPWPRPEVDTANSSAVWPLPALPGTVVSRAVVMRDGQEVGPADGHLELGLLLCDADLWVRVYLVGGPVEHYLDGPHLTLHASNGSHA